MRPFPPGWAAPEGWIPNTDVYISDNGHLEIEIELAGIKKADFELTVEGHRLIIWGQRSDGGRRQKCQYLVTELRYGPFESIVEIPPDYTPAQASADYRNGILRIDVPRELKSQP